MRTLFVEIMLFLCISIVSFAQGTDVVYTPASAKPSIEKALQGLKSYDFDCISNGQRINDNCLFIDAFFIEQMKEFMKNTCPDAEFGTDYRYPSCTHAKIVARYSHTTRLNWSGIWQWIVSNVEVTFYFGISEQYTYTFKLPNFKQNGNDFSGGNVYNSLRERVSRYVLRYNGNMVLKLHSYKTKWTESSLKTYYSTSADQIEGIYESVVSAQGHRDNKYKLGVKKMQDGNYALIYLGGANLYDDWREGEIKAFLSPTSTSRVYKAKWLMLGKDISNDYYITISENSMNVRSNDSNEKYLKLYPTAEMIARNSVSSGTGFFINTKGYIVTNYHCIEDAKSIKVSGVNGDSNKKYNAVVEVTDKQNDLAILRISDSSFRPLANIPYVFKFTTSNVGEDCFVLGYPLISTMGKDIKLTNGIISSKSGYEGNVSQYQISAPVQPGNSGGPVFDKSGNVIGIVQAKHTQAENAGYAIKASYIRNLIELLPIEIKLPQISQLKGKSIPMQVELASKYVCLIIVNGD